MMQTFKKLALHLGLVGSYLAETCNEKLGTFI